MDGGLVTDYAIYDKPSQAHPPGCFFAVNDEVRCDHNQLKFVCKFLRAETVGLGIRYNDLTFSGANSATGFKLLQYFINRQCSNTNLSRIQKVTITDPRPPDRPKQKVLDNFNFQIPPELLAFA